MSVERLLRSDVIHDLRVNEWVIRYRQLVGDALLDWAGPDESRLEPPKLAPYEYRGDARPGWTRRRAGGKGASWEGEKRR